MRKHYLDNLRIFVIFLLFPVHTFMIWNDYGTRFYVWVEESRILSSLMIVVNAWFMPLLFAIAGMTAGYSMKKRGAKGFVIERIEKLLVPFVFGTALLVPVQTLYARKFFFGYEGGYFDNLKYFFTHLTDFSGYDGAFTPGQLWFILFLFIISLIAMIIIHFLPYERVENKISKLKLPAIIAMFVIVWVTYYVGNIGGYSIGKSLALYLLGYYVLRNDDVMDKLEKNTGLLAAIFVVADVILVIAYFKTRYYGDFFVNFVAWTGTLFMLAFGKRFLNRDSGFTEYFNAASFPIYVLHQSILVAIAYYTVRAVDNIYIQIAIIMLGSFALTVLCYEVVKRIPILRNMLGIKKIKSKTEEAAR